MNGVSPNGKYGGMRLCQISGAGSVSWKGLGLFRLSIIWGFVGEMMLSRPRSLGWEGLGGWLVVLRLRGEESLMGDWLLALLAVGAEADLTLLDGIGLFLEREAALLVGDFLAGFLICGAGGRSVC